jgi:hypothetical protein
MPTITYDDDQNLEWIIDKTTGKPKQIIKDGGRLRVSLLDALAARDQSSDFAARQQLSDAEKYVMRDAEWRRASYYNRPGWRIPAGC